MYLIASKNLIIKIPKNIFKRVIKINSKVENSLYCKPSVISKNFKENEKNMDISKEPPQRKKLGLILVQIRQRLFIISQFLK